MKRKTLSQLLVSMMSLTILLANANEPMAPMEAQKPASPMQPRTPMQPHTPMQPRFPMVPMKPTAPMRSSYYKINVDSVDDIRIVIKPNAVEDVKLVKPISPVPAPRKVRATAPIRLH